MNIKRKILDIDKRVLFFFQNLNSPAFVVNFFKLITILWDYWFIWWAISFYFLFLWWNFFYIWIKILLSIVIILFLWEIILKNIFRRKRPYNRYKKINSLAVNTPKSFSFPSWHTSLLVAISTVLTQYFWGFLLIILYCITVLIIISRLFLRVHYFSDIIWWIVLWLIIGFLI